MNNEEAKKMVSEMKREILDRGYITHALTDKNGRILGFGKKYYERDYSEKNAPFYWSEVYCEPDYMCTIIRQGMLLINKSDEEMTKYYLQSLVNVNENPDKLPPKLNSKL